MKIELDITDEAMIAILEKELKTHLGFNEKTIKEFQDKKDIKKYQKEDLEYSLKFRDAVHLILEYYGIEYNES